jgi:hypothetical protein
MTVIVAATAINDKDFNDRCGGIFASQVIRLIGNIYSQTMCIYITEERPLSYPNSLKFR